MRPPQLPPPPQLPLRADPVAVCSDHPFSTDCEDAAGITASAETLAACEQSLAGCEDQPATGGIRTCQGAFFHLSFVHSWCHHATMTSEQEALIHQYEDFCLNCEAGSQYNATLPPCGQPTCDDTTQAVAAFETLNTTCTAEGGPGSCCTTTEQQAAWKVVLAAHDLCDHDDVPEYIEHGKHDFEEACEDHGCNIGDEGYDATVCPPPPPAPEEVDCEDHGHDHGRRFLHEHDEECEHGHGLLIGAFVVVLLLAVVAVVVMKQKEIGPFADKGSSSG